MLARSTPRLISVLLLTLVGLCTATPTATAQSVIYSGHTHGAIDPCDCPVAPYGSLARRASLIKEWRKASPKALLIDMGYNIAGSDQDLHTAGEATDARRQSLVWRSMKHMGYQAMIPGDDAWQRGAAFLTDAYQATNAPWVQLNPPQNIAINSDIIVPWIESSDNTVRLTSYRQTPDPSDSNAWNKDFTAYFEKAPDKRKHVLVLHGSRQFLRDVANAFPQFDAIIWAHPDGVNQGHWTHNKRTLVSTSSDEGKSLQRITLAPNKIAQTQEAKLHDGYDSDQTIATWVKAFHHGIASEPDTQVRVDVLLPSQLDQGKELLAMLSNVSQRTIRIRWEFRLPLVGPTSSEATALAHTLASIRLKHPDKAWAFIQHRLSQPDTSLTASIKALGLTDISAQPTPQTTMLIDEDATYQRRQQSARAPAVFINHRLYSSPLVSDRFLRQLCQLTPFKAGQETLCDALPACYTDYDCHTPGELTTCENPGTQQARCKHAPATPVDTAVIIPAHAAFPVHEAVLKHLAFFAPGIKPTILTHDSPEAKALIARYTISRLPAFLFAPSMAKTHRFEALRPGLTRLIAQDGATEPAKYAFEFKPERINANIYISRPRREGGIAIYLAPRSPAYPHVIASLQHALEQGGKTTADLKKISWHPRLSSETSSPLGLADWEDAQRMLVVKEQFPQFFWPYAMARAVQPQSTYWRKPLRAAGLSLEQIKTVEAATAKKRSTQALWQTCRELDETGPQQDFILLHNQEKIPLSPGLNLTKLLNDVLP